MPEFLSGLELCQAYYQEAVRPVLEAHFPGLGYSAALIGYGSDVLGFDTPVSRDHLWGPRVWLFLPQANFTKQKAAIYEALRQNLPVRFRGYSTHFSLPDEADKGTRVMQEVEQGPVEPLIFFETLASFFESHLGVDPTTSAMLEPADWLTFSEQQLLEVTDGRVFYDGLGLEEIRRRFAYYPQDVWLYLLAAQWALIAQEEAFVGRTDQVGDRLGSRVITARLVERFMRLCFLMEKRYAPYSKWFGTGFQKLACAPEMLPLFEGLLAANTYAERDHLFSQVYPRLVEMHNALGITPLLETRTRTYSGWHRLRAGVQELALDDPANTRPFQVIFADRIVDAIQAAIQDPQVKRLRPRLGGVSQFFTPSSDALQSVDFCRQLKDDLQER